MASSLRAGGGATPPAHPGSGARTRHARQRTSQALRALALPCCLERNIAHINALANTAIHGRYLAPRRLLPCRRRQRAKMTGGLLRGGGQRCPGYALCFWPTKQCANCPLARTYIAIVLHFTPEDAQPLHAVQIVVVDAGATQQHAQEASPQAVAETAGGNAVQRDVEHAERKHAETNRARTLLTKQAKQAPKSVMSAKHKPLCCPGGQQERR